MLRMSFCGSKKIDEACIKINGRKFNTVGVICFDRSIIIF